MKIFSLESKLELVGWSLILGFVLNILIILISFKNDPSFMCHGLCATFWNDIEHKIAGIPFSIQISGSDQGYPLLLSSFVQQALFNWAFWVDYIFWAMILFTCLSFIRYFKPKSYQIPSKQ